MDVHSKCYLCFAVLALCFALFMLIASVSLEAAEAAKPTTSHVKERKACTKCLASSAAGCTLMRHEGAADCSSPAIPHTGIKAGTHELPDGTFVIQEGSHTIIVAAPDLSRVQIPEDAPRLQFFFKPDDQCMACRFMKPIWEDFKNSSGKGLVVYDDVDASKIANVREMVESEVVSVPTIIFKRNRRDKGIKMPQMAPRTKEAVYMFVTQQLVATETAEVPSQ